MRGRARSSAIYALPDDRMPAGSGSGIAGVRRSDPVYPAK